MFVCMSFYNNVNVLLYGSDKDSEKRRIEKRG